MLLGVIFMVTLVGCIGLVLFLLLHTDWWPIFSVLLSIPLGYGLALVIFGFGGSALRGLGRAEPPAGAESEAAAGDGAADKQDTKPV